MPAAEPRQPVRREETRSHDEDERLQGVGVRDRPHPAEHRVEPGEQHDRHGADPEAVERGASDVQPHLGQEGREDDPPCEDRDRELGEHVRREGDHRQHPASGRGEAPPQKLRHRVHQRARIERDEDPSQHEQAPGMQLVVGQRHAAGGARAREPHDVLRPDIGREDGRAHEELSLVTSMTTTNSLTPW